MEQVSQSSLFELKVPFFCAFMENINQVNEAKLLGYFESIKSVFLLKIIFLIAFVKDDNGKRSIDVMRLPQDAIQRATSMLDYPMLYAALVKGNEEIPKNYIEDIVTAGVMSSWIVFEQIIKDLKVNDYSMNKDDQSLDYKWGKFQFDSREKMDLDLFYYIRNAIQHYNGAYYAYKDIDHRFEGCDFKSSGHYGEKIDVSILLVWRIILALERYALKAWNSVQTFDSKH